MEQKKYELDELKIGMQVCPEQLDNIMNMYFIILYDAKNRKIGKLVFMGKEQNEEYDSWFMQTKPITPIYNRREDVDDMVVYDE